MSTRPLSNRPDGLPENKPLNFERLNDPVAPKNEAKKATPKRPAKRAKSQSQGPDTSVGSADQQESFFLPSPKEGARGKTTANFKERKQQKKPLPSGRKEPKKATAKYLERYALWYLERYASSCENLRRSLRRKVALSARTHGTDPQEGEEAIEALIDRLRRIGALNDEVYARGRVQTLHRRGTSQRAIRQKLAAKGLGEDDINKALENLAEEQRGDPEVLAALAYTRRRRLGPYRPEEKREDLRDRDMAALGRQGFSYDLVRRIITAEDQSDLEALEEEARER